MNATEALREGGLAIFPTETLWSLSCSALQPEAVQRVFEAKRRPEGVPLAVGFSSWGMAQQYVHPTPLAQQLAQHLPGAFSMVLERRDDRLAHVAPGLSTVSIRVPAHPAAQELLNKVGPLVMTSANRHGEADPLTAEEVMQTFPQIPVVDGEIGGTGSTIIDARGKEPIILREGAVRLDRLISQHDYL